MGEWKDLRSVFRAAAAEEEEQAPPFTVLPGAVAGEDGEPEGPRAAVARIQPPHRHRQRGRAARAGGGGDGAVPDLGGLGRGHRDPRRGL